MTDTQNTKLVNKFGGWERLVVFSGVVMTVPIFALLGTAFYAISHEREGAVMGVILSVIALLVLWALVWGALWIVTGFRSGSFVPPMSSAAELNELRRENAMLKELLAEQSRTENTS